MVTPQKQWEIVQEEPDAAPPAEDKHLSLLLLGLKTLSQRALTAVADLFTLVTIFGAWWLWYQVPDPTPNQIVSLSIYAAFTLAANWLVRR